jgi:hypothetical protein
MLCMLGSHHVHKDKKRKIHKMFMLVKWGEVGNAVLMPLSFVLFSLWMTPIRMWWPSVVSRMKMASILVETFSL